MRNITRSFLRAGIHAAMLAALSGCAELAEQPAIEEVEPPATVEEEEFSYGRVMDLLREGEAGRAETMLRSRLEAEPGDTQARDLLQQIETSPVEYLGESSFQYEVQAGESLSVLAQRFLGNHQLFYILARYNDINNPSLVHSGEMIRIPRNYWVGPKPSREPLDREIRAREYLSDGRPKDALRLYDEVTPDALGSGELALLRVLHRRWIERALNDGDLEAARERIAEARRQAPDNGNWKEWLAAMDRRMTAEAAFRKARTLQNRDPVAAAHALNRAIEADPRHTRARDALAALRTEVVPELHREAVILYRNQALDRAIALWERALSIDPDYQPAQGYHARAEELRRRLNALD